MYLPVSREKNTTRELACRSQNTFHIISIAAKKPKLWSIFPQLQYSIQHFQKFLQFENVGYMRFILSKTKINRTVCTAEKITSWGNFTWSAKRTCLSQFLQSLSFAVKTNPKSHTVVVIVWKLRNTEPCTQFSYNAATRNT